MANVDQLVPSIVTTLINPIKIICRQVRSFKLGAILGGPVGQSRINARCRGIIRCSNRCIIGLTIIRTLSFPTFSFYLYRFKL